MRTAPESVIKAAHKALCQTYHPDKFKGRREEAERIIKIINASYTVLINPVKRKEHDDWIKNKEADAATKWCENAGEYLLKNGGKAWKYLLIPHDEVKENFQLVDHVQKFERV